MTFRISYFTWVGLLGLLISSLRMTSSESEIRLHSNDAGQMISDFIFTNHTHDSRELQSSSNIESLYPVNPLIKLMHDPPNGFFSHTALAVYVQAKHPYSQTAKIYYSFEVVNTGFENIGIIPTKPTLKSSYATFDKPYIHMATPFGARRNRTLTIVAVDEASRTRSNQIILWFIIEADARPNAYGFLVPGVETKGVFIKFYLEMKAAARAQAAGGQEFSDFYTPLGVGTYTGQLFPMNLTKIHGDLTGFEGGFTVNCSLTRHYGILVPFHNGKKFTGKVVRVNLIDMSDTAACLANYRIERWVNGAVQVTGPGSTDACVYVVDLASKYPYARGFRRGFVSYPYAFLSPSEFSVAVRLDVCNFGMATTSFLDLTQVGVEYGGYSGGFSDGNWACFNPMKTFTGPFGGIRSGESVDTGHLTPFYHGKALCIEKIAWTNPSKLNVSIVTMDFSDIEPNLRGFSESIKVGRYAYFAPLAYLPNAYASRIVRIYLGEVDIGTTIRMLQLTDGGIADLADVLDLSQKNDELRGYTGLFSSGAFLFLAPYRNSYQPRIGQRGHGKIVRVDLNKFSSDGIEFLDAEKTVREQIPSTADDDLRGFSGGFASGKYQVFIPFFNGLFSGKLARIVGIATNMYNLQELDCTVDRLNPGAFKAFTGGFVSLWRGAEVD